MFSPARAGKLALAVFAIVAGVAAAQPASAQPYYPSWRRPRPIWRPYRAWVPPIGYHVAPFCVTRRVWVPTPFGPRPVLRRFCRW
jgi:hypothetical protein